jgi:site-specific DNA recombinase
MKNNKKTVVYARTASKKQNIDLQLEAAKPYLKGIPEENIIIITDQVPATSQPEGFDNLLDLIRNDQVETLIVYKRDRITRNLDEYLDLLKLINHHQVKVAFTASGHPPININLQIESLYADIINRERIIMSNRIKTALKVKHS